MKLPLLPLFSISAVCMVLAGPALASVDDLSPIPSARFDQLLVNPASDWRSLRKVVISPVRVDFQAGGYRSRFAAPADTARAAREFSRDLASSVRDALREALSARGYEVVGAAGPGVLVLSPSIEELYVSAPEAPSFADQRSFVREVGQATLRVEGRDAATGRPLVLAVRHGKAETTGGTFEPASDVANRFWFEKMVQRWAADFADELQARELPPGA